MANKTYRAFGRCVRSFVRLPAPEVAGDQVDWDIVDAGSTPSSNDVPTDDALVPSGLPDVFDAPGFARFTITDRRIAVQHAAGRESSELVSTLTGTLSAFLLAREDHLVMHGTTLLHRGRLVIFCGNAGAGKSTQAAALLGSGWGLHADDVAPIDLSGKTPKMHRGYTALRLFPDSFKLLGLDPAAHPVLHRGTVKRLMEIPLENTGDSVPRHIAGLVILEPGEEMDHQLLNEREAMIALLNFQHPTGALVYNSGASARGRVFEHCQALARAVPTVVVRRKKEPANLLRVGEWVDKLLLT